METIEGAVTRCDCCACCGIVKGLTVFLFRDHTIKRTATDVNSPLTNHEFGEKNEEEGVLTAMVNARAASCGILVALLLLSPLVSAGANGGTKRRGSLQQQQEHEADLPPAYEAQEETGETRVDDAAYSRDQQLATLPKADQIAFYEAEVDWIRQHEVEPALRQLSQSTAAYDQAKKAGGWFPNAQQKETIAIMEDEYRRAARQLERVKSRELQTLKKIKPLYGIVSYQWMQEQRASIRNSLKTVNEMAYNQAWWSSLFNSRAESLTDLIVQFFVSWLISYVILYPFAAIYYLLWESPWSIFDYSSSWTDVFVGVAAWLGTAIAMLLPLAALVVGIYAVAKLYGPQLEARAEARRRHGGY